MEALARRFLALWQEQFVAAASDPELAATLARVLTVAGAALAPWTAALEAAARAGDGHDRTAPHGATPAAAPSRDGSGDVADLARRLAALEERLAQLEAGARGGGVRSRDRARRRRS
ncbi:MAG: hypothetical protein IRZ04_09430 [Rhodospirillales bacterium]|nr:hypothetical protein [Rhodospirillales bacterium]